MRQALFALCLYWTQCLLSAEAAPTTIAPALSDPAAIARDFLTRTENSIEFNFLPISARGPAVDVVLPLLAPTTPVATLERAFDLMEYLDARRPETIARIRPFLAPGQPLQWRAVRAIESLGHDAEALIPDLIALIPSKMCFACDALGKIGRHGEMVVPALLAALHDKDGRLQSGIISVLGNPAWAMQADIIVPVLTAIIAAPEPPLPDEWGCAARRRDEQYETVVDRTGSFQMIDPLIHPSSASHGRMSFGALSP